MLTIAVLDACVLYPPALRDLLMRLATGGLYAPRFTEEIHAEWIESLLRHQPDTSRTRLERTRRLMNESDPAALVTGYEQHIPALQLPDPDDRHVLAAAMETGATVIVTFNLRDFPAAKLSPFGVRAQHPDQFVCGLYDAEPTQTLMALRRQRESLNNPPYTAEEMQETFRRNGLTKFAARLENHLGDF